MERRGSWDCGSTGRRPPHEKTDTGISGADGARALATPSQATLMVQSTRARELLAPIPGAKPSYTKSPRASNRTLSCRWRSAHCVRERPLAECLGEQLSSSPWGRSRSRRPRWVRGRRYAGLTGPRPRWSCLHSPPSRWSRARGATYTMPAEPVFIPGCSFVRPQRRAPSAWRSR